MKKLILLSILICLFLKISFAQHVCIDKRLTPQQSVPIDAQSAAFLIGKTWENEKTLRVKFIGGNNYVQNKVIQYAKEWEDYANIKFNFVTSGNADIRISFTQGIGSWSYLGIDAQQIPQNEPTMNFGWFDNNTSESEFSRTTIHEFGHALGLVHEHQHPTNNIPWNKPVVYSYYMQSQGWSKDDVDFQVFGKYSVNQTYYCSYDRNSIMHYPIPQQHTIGNYEIGWNTVLSTKDKRAVRNMYPFSSDYNPFWTGAGNNGKWYIGDFNGDGKDDIFRYMPGKSGAEVILSNGSRFSGIKSWTGAGKGNQDWYIGDFNGDGKDDILRYISGKSGAEVFLSNGTSFKGAGSWTGAGNNGKWYVGDFNGDGKDDIFRYMPGESGAQVFLSNGTSFKGAGSWTGAGYGNQKWYVGDFNGDGKDDIFRYMSGKSGADVFLSNGSSFKGAGSWTGAGNSGKWYVGDFNGDGKDDIFRNKNGKNGAEVLLSNGTKFGSIKTWTNADYGDQDWFLGDFDGDNKVDIFRYKSKIAGAHMFLSNGSQFFSSDEDCNF